MVCTRAISPNHQPVPKDAGFRVVQASLLLTHHLPLKETLVLLTTIPKGILIFFYTQFIQRYIMLYSFSNFYTREEIIHWIILPPVRNVSVKYQKNYLIEFWSHFLGKKISFLALIECGVTFLFFYRNVRQAESSKIS